jgi:transcriptional regulator with XRE-family HTH domain
MVTPARGAPRDRDSEPFGRLLSSHRAGPTVLRMVVGAQLRRLREAKGISAADAGYAIRATHSKISRMELGRVSFRPRDIADLLTMYGVHDEQERSAFLTLATEANVPGWWHDSADLLPGWFEPYLGLEEAASIIRNYEVQFVPGQLQTADYARAVILLGYPEATAEEIERRIALRISRQQLLARAEGPHFWAVLDEAVLRRPLGGPGVMRGQVDHLIEAAARPNVTVQVVPFRAGGHSAAGGPFSLLRFPEPDLPDVVYLEQLTSALYLDRREDVDSYHAVMERLCLQAPPDTDTVKILKEIRESL